MFNMNEYDEHNGTIDINAAFDDILTHNGLDEIVYSRIFENEVKELSFAINGALRKTGGACTLCFCVPWILYYRLRYYGYCDAVADVVCCEIGMKAWNWRMKQFYQRTDITMILSYDKLASVKADCFLVIGKEKQCKKIIKKLPPNSRFLEFVVGAAQEFLEAEYYNNPEYYGKAEYYDMAVYDAQGDARTEAIRGAIGFFLYAKDFIAAKPYFDLYIKEQHANFHSYERAWCEIMSLLECIPAVLQRKRGMNVIFLVLDAWKYSHLESMPKLSALARNAYQFDNWFSFAGWTRQSFYSMYTGSSFIGRTADMANRDEDGDFSSAPLVSAVTENGYNIHSLAFDERSGGRLHRVSQTETFPHDILTHPPCSLILWDILAEVGLSNNAFIFAHSLHETHDNFGRSAYKTAMAQFKRGEIGFDELQRVFLTEERAMMNGLDAQISFYTELLCLDNTTIILTADHGRPSIGNLKRTCGIPFYNFYSDEMYHVPFIVLAPGLAPGRCDKLMSHLDLHHTLDSILADRGLSRLCDNEYIRMEELPVYSTAEHKRLSAMDSAAAKNTKICGHVTIRTKVDKYMFMADGGESYYILPYDYEPEHDLIGKPEHQERIVYLRSKVERDFWDRFWQDPKYTKAKEFFLGNAQQ
jgi:hypothetical protein